MRVLLFAQMRTRFGNRVITLDGGAHNYGGSFFYAAETPYEGANISRNLLAQLPCARGLKSRPAASTVVFMAGSQGADGSLILPPEIHMHLRFSNKDSLCTVLPGVLILLRPPSFSVCRSTRRPEV